MERGVVKEIFMKGYFILIFFVIGYLIWTNVIKPDLKEMCLLLVDSIAKVGLRWVQISLEISYFSTIFVLIYGFLRRFSLLSRFHHSNYPIDWLLSFFVFFLIDLSSFIIVISLYVNLWQFWPRSFSLTHVISFF